MRQKSENEYPSANRKMVTEYTMDEWFKISYSSKKVILLSNCLKIELTKEGATARNFVIKIIHDSSMILLIDMSDILRNQRCFDDVRIDKLRTLYRRHCLSAMLI